MLMDSFEVENFRSLKHLELKGLARVNLLVGKNNSGKTSVLEALYMVLSVGSTSGISTIEHERNIKIVDFRQLFYELNTVYPITLKAIHRIEGETTPVEDSILTTSIKAIENTKGIPNSILSRINKSVPITTIESSTIFYKQPESLRFSINRLDDGSLIATPTQQEAIAKLDKKFAFSAAARYAIAELLTTTIDRAVLVQKITALKISKSIDYLLHIMQGIDSRIESIDLIDGEIYLDLGPKFGTLLLLNLMGEGIQRLLDIASAMVNVSGGIVLIDEIDNGLHYSALRILWKGILQAAHEYDVQVFATTHSAEALRHLTWVLDDEENTSYRDDVAAYTLVRADDDTVRSYRHDYEQLDYALDHGLEVRN